MPDPNVAGVRLLRRIRAQAALGNLESIHLHIDTELANYIQNHFRSQLSQIEQKHDIKILINLETICSYDEITVVQRSVPKTPEPAELVSNEIKKPKKKRRRRKKRTTESSSQTAAGETQEAQPKPATIPEEKKSYRTPKQSAERQAPGSMNSPSSHKRPRADRPRSEPQKNENQQTQQSTASTDSTNAERRRRRRKRRRKPQELPTGS